MGSAFTENEKDIIKEQLKAHARECIKKYGMKKTTVDQLVEKVGISKGAFYRFYDSKELLFFELMEDFHSEFFELALKILHERTDLNNRERLEETIWQVCLFVLKSEFMSDTDTDFIYLLRKIPPDILKEHYHSSNAHILELINQANVPLAVSPDFVCAAVYTLEILMTNKDGIGKEHLTEILRIFIKGLCEKIVES